MSIASKISDMVDRASSKRRGPNADSADFGAVATAVDETEDQDDAVDFVAGRAKDSSGRAEDSSGQAKDSSARAEDSPGQAKDWMC